MELPPLLAVLDVPDVRRAAVVRDVPLREVVLLRAVDPLRERAAEPVFETARFAFEAAPVAFFATERVAFAAVPVAFFAVERAAVPREVPVLREVPVERVRADVVFARDVVLRDAVVLLRAVPARAEVVLLRAVPLREPVVVFARDVVLRDPVVLFARDVVPLFDPEAVRDVRDAPVPVLPVVFFSGIYSTSWVCGVGR